MIAIINYGLGNISAFGNVYKKLNIPFKIVQNANELISARKIILPGVGAFDYAMERLNRSGMRETLDKMVINNQVPVLGICVGMQMLAKSSEEGNLPGLSWIDGDVRKFILKSKSDPFYIPHMGWNNIKPTKESNLLKQIDQNSSFYFLHSYYFHCFNSNDILAVTDYGEKFSCVVKSKNIYGVQFHPEKSHQWGIQLLKNFAEI